MKTAISIPDAIFRKADAFAKRRSMSRSELFAKAVQAYLESHRDDDLTQRFNEVYAEEPSQFDPALAAMRATTLWKETW